jgi:hypothetical protein
MRLHAPGRFARVGYTVTPHDEHPQVETEEQGHGSDQHVLHGGSLPSEAVRTLRNVESEPEERGLVVKYKTHAQQVVPGHADVWVADSMPMRLRRSPGWSNTEITIA